MTQGPFELRRDAFLRPTVLRKSKTGSANLGEVLVEDSAIAPLQVVEPLTVEQRDAMRALFDAPPRISHALGAHPHFAQLTDGSGEFFHCTSVFIDIQNSTHLGVVLPPADAFFLKNAVLRLAIAVFQSFGGHVHRLQGDGLFAQFVSKDLSAKSTALAALDAASMFLYLITKHLNPNIIEPVLDPIFVRVGVDYGNDDEVLWARYGSSACEEFTTTGLHVDLASKLQSDAPSNGMMVGDNVVKLLQLQDDYLSVRTRTVEGQKREFPEIRLQPKGQDFRYRKWVFNWEKWTEHVQWFGQDERCSIHADYGDDEDGPFPYALKPFQRIRKGKWIRFVASGFPPYANRLRWTVVNQGVEAVVVGQKFNSSTGDTMYRTTEYTGLHYAFFKASADSRVVSRAFFAVRVVDD